MSQHPSLKIDSVGIQHRNVLKRYERIKKLQDEEKWEEGRSVFGLPKVKLLKMKVKKAAKVPEKAEEAVPGAEGVPASAEKEKAATDKGASKQQDK